MATFYDLEYKLAVKHLNVMSDIMPVLDPTQFLYELWWKHGHNGKYYYAGDLSNFSLEEFIRNDVLRS